MFADSGEALFQGGVLQHEHRTKLTCENNAQVSPNNEGALSFKDLDIRYC